MNTIMYNSCTEKGCNSISIQGNNIVLPVLFGVAVGLVIAKSLT
ncbi:hypothetical protein ACQY1Q_05945 [Tenacibaculum sp. TC6]